MTTRKTQPKLNLHSPEGYGKTPPEIDPEILALEVTTDETEDKPLYSSDYFKAANIPYCETCGEQYRTLADDTPICPINKKDCDRNVEK